MHLGKRTWLSKNKKTYTSILLRESYREGKKVKKRTVANSTHCPPEQVRAIEWALKNPQRIEALAEDNGGGEVRLREGKSSRGKTTIWPNARGPKFLVALRCVSERIARLKISKWLGAEIDGRTLRAQIDQAALENESRLDGCYVIVTDLKAAALSLTIEEGLDSLKTLCSMRLQLADGVEILRIPEPRQNSAELLEAAGVKLPEALSHSPAHVVTKKTLPPKRLPGRYYKG